MASGFVGGILVGTVVAGAAIGAVSLLAGLPAARQPETIALDIPVGSEFNQPRDDGWAELPGAETTPDAVISLQADAPVPDDLNAMNSEATETAALPDAGNSTGGLSLPQDIEDDTGFAAVSAPDSPVLQQPSVATPAVPDSESVLAIATKPAGLPAYEDPQVEIALIPEQPVNMHVSTAAVLADLLELPQGPADENRQPSISLDTAALNIPKIAPAQPMLQKISAISPALPLDEDFMKDAKIAVVTPQAPTGPVTQSDHDLTPDVAITDATDSDSASDKRASPRRLAQEGAGSDEEGAGLPKSGGFENLAPDVTTNRLPSVTDTPAVEEDTTEADPVGEAQTDTRPQLERYAAEFENPDAKPLMAIVLIDDGTSKLGLEELKDFPYPLSFAIDTRWPGAPQAMRAYRDAGFEVLAMADLPKGAGAADTEVTMAIYLRAVPEAVAVMEGLGQGLQSGRKASEQMAQILAASGLGVVMLPKGLNTAQKLIAREGVPAITAFRDFDGKGQSAQTIQRFLDRAVLKAGQEENGVIMVGRLRDTTINALVVWALEDRAARVAMAPVSAVLRGE